MTPVSQIDFGADTYIEGNLVGILKGDSRHKKRSVKTHELIDLSDPHKLDGKAISLYGEWKGTVAGEEVSFTFLENNKGKYNGTPFTCQLNSPTRGGIAIQLETGGTISFTMVDISDHAMTIIMKGSEKRVTLYRQ